MTKVNYKSTSPYYNTPQTIWYLSMYSPRSLERDGTDKEYIIPDKFENRPDLAANFLFGNSEYWWVFSILNKDTIIDPINDFKTGLEIIIPTRERLNTIQ